MISTINYQTRLYAKLMFQKVTLTTSNGKLLYTFTVLSKQEDLSPFLHKFATDMFSKQTMLPAVFFTPHASTKEISIFQNPFN